LFDIEVIFEKGQNPHGEGSGEETSDQKKPFLSLVEEGFCRKTENRDRAMPRESQERRKKGC